MSNGSSMYRTNGRTMIPRRRHFFVASNFDRAVTDRMCVIAAAGNKAFKLTCVSSEKGAPVTVQSIRHAEYFASGSAVKLATRFYFVESEITTTPGSTLYIPQFQALGHVDVLASDYEVIEDDATATNGIAQAYIRNIGLTIYPGDYTKEVFVAVQAREGSKTYASGCITETELFIDQH